MNSVDGYAQIWGEHAPNVLASPKTTFINSPKCAGFSLLYLRLFGIGTRPKSLLRSDRLDESLFSSDFASWIYELSVTLGEAVGSTENESVAAVVGEAESGPLICRSSAMAGAAGQGGYNWDVVHFYGGKPPTSSLVTVATSGTPTREQSKCGMFYSRVSPPYKCQDLKFCNDKLMYHAEGCDMHAFDPSAIRESQKFFEQVSGTIS